MENKTGRQKSTNQGTYVYTHVVRDKKKKGGFWFLFWFLSYMPYLHLMQQFLCNGYYFCEGVGEKH